MIKLDFFYKKKKLLFLEDFFIKYFGSNLY
jgi:hypothetical protein